MRAVRAAMSVVLALAAIAAAAAAADKMYVVYGFWVSPKTCHVRNAVDVAFADHAARPQEYQRKCIAVRGHLGARALFESLGAYYALGGSPSDEDEHHVRLGLYADDQTMRALYRAARHDVKIIGQAGTCDDLHAEGVVMVLGYCHYTGGPVIFMSDFTPVSAEPRRMTRAQLPPAHANLREVPEGEPLHAQVKDIAGRWLDAVRRTDVNAFLALDEDATIEDRYRPDEILNQLFVTKRDAYGLITRSDDPPPFAVFEIPRSDPDDWFEAYGCFCKTSDCAATWPAHARDAGARPAWPYACVYIQYAPGDPPEVRTRP